MSGQLVYVLCVLAIMLALFVSNRVRLDLVALMGLLALTLGGVISTSEALAGFAEPVVLMIAALFVVGAGLFQTGVADALGRQVERLAGHGVMALTAVIMLVTAILSAFLSSTGTVAVMLPVVLAIARRQRIQPSRLLMPVAFAALLGGMLTLIGTPPNLIVSDQLDQAGLASFGFFDFTGPGLVMLVIGMACMLVLAPRLIPERAGAETGAVPARLGRIVRALRIAGKTGPPESADRINAGISRHQQQRVAFALWSDGGGHCQSNSPRSILPQGRAGQHHSRRRPVARGGA
jgi:di/tricarboxylate transporter